MRLEETNSVQLWKMFIQGDDESFASIYRLFNKQLYRYGLSIAKADDVEDAIQDLFIRLHKNRAHLPEVENVKSYLIISLKNALLKKHNQGKMLSSIDDATGIQEQLFHPDLTIEELIVRQEENEYDDVILNELRSFLTTREEEAVYYRFIQQLAYKEIAEKMAIQEQSAKNLVQTALKKMRRHIPFVVLFKLWLSLI